MAEVFDDFEMGDFGRKYPEYDDMTDEEIYSEYQNLSQERLDLLRGDSVPQDEKYADVINRMSYIERTGRMKGVAETTFTGNKDGTGTINTRRDSFEAPGIEFPDVEQEMSDIPSLLVSKKDVIEEFISRRYKIKDSGLI